MSVTMEEWNEACQAVVKKAQQSPAGSLIQYGAAYAQRGYMMYGEERRVQALYILNNLGGWRGNEAKATKEIFKRASKAK
ncbi:hypothetical protein PP935_gp070 [Rhizobium phage RHph_N34]|uniref:Uncharacterized protein n=2 Tax=Trinifflemingvirus TaxID=3044848 RepID=A0A7S5RIK2_9CAUD|nr:hypothetical protein PP935_gp070 [Rhizobium phage RHph_N34]YP_010661705.1 hypothetical protein PP936_gp067 [Rhizobium phage RHph_I1_9]QIG69637.1 hypothetical protein EVB81_068 [Rhizobium phage RHph_I46]QIG70918.1 hypothetical protein EVB92_068 [Rhizobium phage RHph_I9]QIG76257.1 hypothetical protein EVC25_068 [Rhizobium phage RHph_I34]QIG73504.1 hypothetical protein EVC04_067 [Rhizobium phage RHph_I1_9]QIG73845.1 hypothetical protein EVC06_070 [Rhizobium phage RHph_N34]